MEQFLKSVRAYADLVGVKPSTVIQKAGVGGGGTWAAWECGASSPTLHTVDRLHAYMIENPAPPTEDAA